MKTDLFEINVAILQMVEDTMNTIATSVLGDILKIEKLAWKDIFMTFLLAINEDLDDDLLQDAMDLLVDLWYPWKHTF